MDNFDSYYDNYYDDWNKLLSLYNVAETRLPFPYKEQSNKSE